MSQQQQAKMQTPWPGAAGYRHAGYGSQRWAGLRGNRNFKTFLLVMACGLLFGAALAFLGRLSGNKPRSQTSELGAAKPVPSSGATASGGADQPINNNSAIVGQQPSAGSRYRVVVETAYFFDAPRQSTPNGRYLRRGDVFYGEGETNGFVKTGFVQPNGATGFGWLKAQELSKLAEVPAPKAVASSRPRPAVAKPVVPSRSGAVGAVTPGVPSDQARANSAKTAVVRVARSYFYNSPDLLQPRKAYCEQGEKVRLGESRGEAVYVTFTNWERVTTTGWMRKDALRFTR